MFQFKLLYFLTTLGMLTTLGFCESTSTVATSATSIVTPKQSFGPKNADRLLILCPNETLASTLSFHTAYELAAITQQTQHVLYICVQQRFEIIPPLYVSIQQSAEDLSGNLNTFKFSSQQQQQQQPKPMTVSPASSSSPYSTASNNTKNGFFWDPHVLSRISIKYVTSLTNLKEVLSSTHTIRPTISAIVINNLHSIVDPGISLSRADSVQYEQVVQTIHFLGDSVHFLMPILTSNTNNDHTEISAGLRLVVTESEAGATYLAAIRSIFCSRHIVCRPLSVSSASSFGVASATKRPIANSPTPHGGRSTYSGVESSSELLYRDGIKEWIAADFRGCFSTGLTVHPDSPGSGTVSMTRQSVN